MATLDQERQFSASPETPGSSFAILRILALLLPLALFLPGINAFPYPSEQARYSDLVLAHYPYAFYLRHTILLGQGLPTWSPLIMSGAPLAANPLASMWYPPAWLALIFPLPLGFNLAIMAHLLWGGVGMYRLLRLEKIDHRAALFGALAFEAMPKIFAHYGAGHLTLLYAVCWTPWLLWASMKEGVGIFGLNFSWRPAAILAMIFLADVRWTAYAGVLWLGYVLAHKFKRGYPKVKEKFALFPNLLGQLIVAGLLAAPLGIPFLEYTRLSTRPQMSVKDFLEFSLPVSRLLGLLFPDPGGFHEWILYVGGATFLLSLMALFWMASRPSARFWGWVAGLSLLYSLGSTIPLIPFLARLPGFNLLRVPSRSLFLACMAFVILAACAIDGMLRDITDIQKKRGSLILVAVIGFTLALTAGVFAMSGQLALNFLWGGAAILVGGIWIGLRLAGRITARAWYIGLLSICLLDWGLMDRSLFATKPADLVFAEGRQLAGYLASEKGLFRVYSPSYSLPQQTGARYGLQMADGVDPLQIRSYVRFMRAASGVPDAGYQVTVPPFANGDPNSDNEPYQPDPELLGLLNVRFVAADFDLGVDGLELLDRFGDTRLYENKEAMPRAWVQPMGSPPGQDAIEVDIVRWTPERIELHAQGPGLLVLSEVAYPGWSVMVDGSSARIEVIGGLLRGVNLGEGDHNVTFYYQPLSLYLGLSLCIAAIIFLAAGSLIRRDKIHPAANIFQEADKSQQALDMPEEAAES